MFKYIRKNIELIENHKEEILDLWMRYEIVQEKLKKNTFDINFFKEKFASKVFDYALSVVNEKNKAGDCPVMGVMLMLFKKKNIPLADIFIICVHLKNSLLHFAYKNSLLNHDTIKEISMLMDYNFEGVINEYVVLYYKDNLIFNKEKKKLPQEEESEDKKKTTVEIKKQVLNTKLETASHTSAELYFQEVDVDMDTIEELDELEGDTLDAISAQETLDQNSLDESSHLFFKYSVALGTMLEFEELAYTLKLLSDLLRESDCNSMSEDTKFMVDIYLKAIISDLKSWRKAIFIKMEAENIHYLDKTLLSSIAQIQMTLLPQEESQDDEIEFF